MLQKDRWVNRWKLPVIDCTGKRAKRPILPMMLESSTISAEIDHKRCYACGQFRDVLVVDCIGETASLAMCESCIAKWFHTYQNLLKEKENEL